MSTTNFLIITTRHDGWNGAVLFWGPNRCGYTTRLEDAGRYSAEEAYRLHGKEDFAIPVDDRLESLSFRTIDREHQKKLIQKSKRLARKSKLAGTDV